MILGFQFNITINKLMVILSQVLPVYCEEETAYYHGLEKTSHQQDEKLDLTEDT